MASHEESAEGADQHEDHGINLWGIGACLLVLTILTSCTLFLQGTNFWNSMTNILFVLMISTCKASLVVAYFMHFKFEKGWKYCLCIPPMILFFVLVFSLLPDVAADTYQRVPWNGPLKG